MYRESRKRNNRIKVTPPRKGLFIINQIKAMTEFQLETLSILVDSGDMSAKHLAKQVCKKKGIETTLWKRYLLASVNTLYKLEEMGLCFCYSGSFRATLTGIEKVNELLPLKPALSGLFYPPPQ